MKYASTPSTRGPSGPRSHSRRSIMPKTAEKPIDSEFVVYGINAEKKPRAARFDKSQRKLVAKAAELMSLKLHEVTSPEVAAVAKRLQVGRLYANGQGF